jgi:hypothetical protein
MGDWTLGPNKCIRLDVLLQGSVCPRDFAGSFRLCTKGIGPSIDPYLEINCLRYSSRMFTVEKGWCS